MARSYDETLAIYDAIISRNPNFVRKGKSMPYTAANTHMFSLINKEGEVGIRLDKESAEKFKTKFQADIFLSHGAAMRDYVKIPADLLENKAVMADFFEKSFQYVMSLKANPRKKK